MLCKECGGLIANGSTLCRYCGTRVKKRALKTAVSVFLSIFFFVAVATLVALAIVRPENIVTAITSTDVSWMLDETELSEQLVDVINHPQFDDFNIDAASISDFVQRQDVRSEIGIVLERYLAAATEGDFDYHITSSEIIGFLRAVSPEILDEFGVTLTGDDYDAISDMLTSEMLSEFSVNRLLEDADIEYDSIPFVLLTNYPLIILSIIATTLIFSILLLHRKKVRSAYL